MATISDNEFLGEIPKCVSTTTMKTIYSIFADCVDAIASSSDPTLNIKQLVIMRKHLYEYMTSHQVFRDSMFIALLKKYDYGCRLCGYRAPVYVDDSGLVGAFIRNDAELSQFEIAVICSAEEWGCKRQNGKIILHSGPPPKSSDAIISDVFDEEIWSMEPSPKYDTDLIDAQESMYSKSIYLRPLELNPDDYKFADAGFSDEIQAGKDTGMFTALGERVKRGVDMGVSQSVAFLTTTKTKAREALALAGDFADFCVRMLHDSFVKDYIPDLGKLTSEATNAVKLASFLEWFKENSNKLIGIFVGFVLFYLSYKEGMFTPDKKGFLAAAPYLMMLIGNVTSVIDMDPIVDMMQKISLHSGDSDDEHMDSESSTMAYLLGLFSTGLLRLIDKTWAAMSLTQVAKVCTTFVAFARVWEITNMKSIFHYLPTCFGTLYFQHSSVVGYRAYVRAYNHFYIEYNRYRTDSTPVLRDRLIQASRNFFDTVDKDTGCLSTDEITKVTTMIKQVTDVMSPIQVAMGKVARKKPYWIYIVGQMGVGKTYFSRALTEELRAIFKWRPDQVYDRGNTAFWDGYNTDMKIVRIDDFLADRLDPNILNVFTMVSSNPWLLNMATIDNPELGVKGTPFMSYILITTSNFMSPKHVTDIYNRDAWSSRRRLLVELRLTGPDGKAAFYPTDSQLTSGIDNRLDMKKVVKRYGTNLDAKPYLRFVVYKSTSTDICRMTSSISWNQFYTHMINDLVAWSKETEVGIEPSTTTNVLESQMAKNLSANGTRNNLEVINDALTRDFAAKTNVTYHVGTLTPPPEDAEENSDTPSMSMDDQLDAKRKELLAKKQPVKKTEEEEPEKETVEVSVTDRSQIETHGGNKKAAHRKAKVTICSSPCQCHAKLRLCGGGQSLDEESDDEDNPMLKMFKARQKQSTVFNIFDVKKHNLTEMEYIGDKDDLSVTQRVCYFIGGLAGVAGVLGLAYKAKCVFDEFRDDDSPETHRGGAGRVYASNEGRKQAAVARQLHAGPTSLKDVNNTVSRNLVEIYHENSVRQGSALFIRGRMCVMPFHFVLTLEKGDHMIIKSPKSAQPQTVTIESIRRLYWDERKQLPRDLCIVTFERTAAFSDITAHFPKQEAKGSRVRKNLLIVGLGGSLDTPHVPYYFADASYTVVSATGEVTPVSTEHPDVVLDVCYDNNLCIATKSLNKGDCGSLIIDPDTSNKVRYYGMYTSSHGTYKRYFEPFFQEDLVQSPYPLIDEEHIDDGECRTFDPVAHMGGLPIHGRLITKIPRSTVNKIEKSIIFEKFSLANPSVKFPAILSKSDERNVLRIEPLQNVSKYNSPNKPLTKMQQRLLAKAKTILSNRLKNFQPLVETASKRSENEVLSGVEGVPGFDSIPLSGSPGFLHTNKRPTGATGRGHLFDDEEPEGDRPFRRSIRTSTSSGKFLRKRIDDLNLALSCGTLPNDMWWVDCCKMEKLKEAKIKSVGTRIFSMGPLEYFIVCKQYFMDFSKFITDHFENLPFSIGIDVHSRQWHDMWKSAADIAPTGFDGDYHGFDGGIHGELVAAATEIICEWYTAFSADANVERDNTIRRLLMEAYAYGTHVAGDVVYGTNGGTPSGHYLTAIVNSLVNVLYIIMAIINKHPQHANLIWLLYWINTYGDDNLVVTKEDFTGNDLRDFLASIGVVYTPADKNGNEFVSKPLHQLEFLKHTSRKTRGIYFPLCVASSLNGMLNWVVPLPTAEEEAMNYATTWDDALMSLFFFEDHKPYDELYNLCVATAREHGFSHYPSDIQAICRRVEEKWEDIPVRKILLDSRVRFHSGGENLHEGASIAEPIPGVMVEPTERPHRPPVAPISIAAKPIEYSNITSKWFTVATDDWSVTDLQGTNLMRFSVPNDLMKNFQLRQGLENMQYFNFDSIEVKILVNGTKFHQGALIACFAPVPANVSDSTYPGTSLVSALNLQHGFIYPMNNEPVSMIIPFAHPETAIKTSTVSDDSFQGTIGTLQVIVFAPLEAATNSSTTISYTIMVRFVNPKYFLTKPIAAPVTRPVTRRKRDNVKLHGGSPLMVERILEYEKYSPQLHGNSSSKKGDTFITNITEIVGGGGQTIANNTDGDEYDQSANTEAKASLDYGYMDKFMQAMNPIAVFRRPMPHLNPKNGIVYGDLMALHPSTLATTNFSDFSRVDDEMSIPYLMAREAYGTFLTWSETDPADTILSAKLITPGLYTTNFRPSGDVTLPAIPTPDYVFNLFYMYVLRKFTIRLRILASPFATGRLLITPMFAYYGAAPAPSALDSQYQKIITLEENERTYEVTWDIPANIPAKYVCGTHENNLDLGNRELTSVGSFYIAVQTPYKVGEGIPSSCQIFLSYAVPKGGIDLIMPNQNEVKLAAPTLAVNAPRRPRGNVKLHSGGVEMRGDSKKDISDTDALIGTQATEQGTGHAVGPFRNMQVTNHIRDMGKQFQIVGINTASFPLNDNDVIPVSNLLRAASPQSQLLGMYAFYRGGFNWILKGNNTLMAYRPGFVSGASDTPTISPNIRGDRLFHTYTPNANEEIVTFSTAFTTAYKFLLTPQVSGTTTTEYVRNPVESYASVTERSYYLSGDLLVGGGGDNNDRIWMSYDDAFRSGGLVGPNNVTIVEAWRQV